jgi:hypothetical protein
MRYLRTTRGLPGVSQPSGSPTAVPRQLPTTGPASDRGQDGLELGSRLT